MGIPSTGLSKMKIISDNEIIEFFKKILTGLNKFQCRCSFIPCIFHSIFFFKPFVGLVVQNLKTSDSFRHFRLTRYVKKDIFYYFNFLGKNLLFTFKNLLAHLFFLKGVNIFYSYLTNFLNHMSVSFQL